MKVRMRRGREVGEGEMGEWSEGLRWMREG